LYAAQNGYSEAIPGLLALLAGDLDAVRRASAARLLASWTARDRVVDALVTAAEDAHPLVRAGAVEALSESDPDDARVRRVLVRKTKDTARLVRIQAAFGVRSIDLKTLSPEDAQTVQSAFDEWLEAQDELGELHEPQYNCGVFFSARKEFQKAEARYRMAIARSADYLPARQNLALLLADTGREADAETEWLGLLANEADWPPATFGLGLLYGRQGRWSDAAAQLERCVERDSTYPRALYNLGVAYLKLEDFERATTTLERAAKDSGSRADALRELVHTGYLRGDEDAIRRWLPDALRADPRVRNDPDVRRALGDESQP